MKREKEHQWVRVLLILTFLLVISFVNSMPFIFYDKLYVQHDYVFHVARLESYFESVKEFNFFPKIFYSMGNGGGYGVDLFYPSILLLPYAFFRVLGMSTGFASEMFYLVLNFITASTSFLLGYHIFKKIRTGMLISVIYTLSTYRFHDEIVRGALGEVFGFAFMPLAFIGLYSILFDDKKRWYYLPIGMSLLIISHMLSAYMLFLFILFFIVYQYFVRKDTNDFFDRLKLIIYSGIWTLLIVAWQLLPMLEQTLRFKFNYSTTALTVPTDSLLLIIKNSIYSNLSGDPGLTNNIGTFLIITVFALWMFFFKIDKIAKLGLVLSTVLIIMTSSAFPWQLFLRTPIKMIQFPFRLLLFATLFLSLLIGYIFEKKFKSRLSVFIILVLCGIALALNLNYSYTPNFLNINGIEDISNDRDSFGGGQEYVKQGLTYDTVIPSRDDELELSSNKSTKLTVERKHNSLLVKGKAEADTLVKTPFLYYYGYQVQDNKGKKLLTLEKDGRVAFQFPKGEHEISIEYKKTVVQIVASIVSVFSMFFFTIIIIRSKPN